MRTPIAAVLSALLSPVLGILPSRKPPSAADLLAEVLTNAGLDAANTHHLAEQFTAAKASPMQNLFRARAAAGGACPYCGAENDTEEDDSKVALAAALAAINANSARIAALEVALEVAGENPPESFGRTEMPPMSPESR